LETNSHSCGIHPADRSVTSRFRLFGGPVSQGVWLGIQDQALCSCCSHCQAAESSCLVEMPKASSRTESDTIAAVLAGDVEIFHELIRPYERNVYVMALSYMKNESEAEDVAQEAFVNAFRKLASFRLASKFSTWLMSITINEARTRLRRQAIVRMEPLNQLPDENQIVSPAWLRDWREIPSETLEREEIRELLHRAVEELPNMYREVFILRDIEELSINETAEALNLSISSVKVRLHRARLMLQKQLAPQLKMAHRTPKKRWLPWS